MTTVQDLLETLDTHLARYPRMTWQDAYKLLYQGTLGPEHLAADPEAFAARLLAEYEAVSPAADELLYEPVRPDGRLLRVHLRPFKARGGNPERLLKACLAAAGTRWGTPEELAAVWAEAVQASRAGRWPALGDVAAFAAWLAANGDAAVHHSAQYRAAYRPAYRLIAAADRERVLPVAGVPGELGEHSR